MTELSFARPERDAAGEGRLCARPARLTVQGPHGLHRLGLNARRDGLLYIPEAGVSDGPAPLALLLHGAGGNSEDGLRLLRPLADEFGLILLAPPSRRQTWDVILDRFGPDVAFIDRALAHVFARYRVDTDRLFIGGFFDGASYALSLGLANGDLFTHVLAFSPGFVAPGTPRGRARLFVSHGRRDLVLPIEPCSRRIVREVRRAGYDVTYREFDGPHTVPAEIGRQAAEWALAGQTAR